MTSLSASTRSAASFYAHYQGTRMATPHVAGVVALMQHARVKHGKGLLGAQASVAAAIAAA